MAVHIVGGRLVLLLFACLLPSDLGDTYSEPATDPDHPSNGVGKLDTDDPILDVDILPVVKENGAAITEEEREGAEATEEWDVEEESIEGNSVATETADGTEKPEDSDSETNLDAATNLTALNLTDVKLNMTEKPRKIVCIGKNLTENDTSPALVQIVNSTELMQRLSGMKNDTHANCVIVMFYAPWCMFCARTAPHYNALARAFPQMDVLAIDAIHFNSLNARFGTIAVPNILVFHSSKAVARFNSTTRTLESMRDFVTNVTGLVANSSVDLIPADYEGPLPSQPTEESDYLLWAACIFVIGFSASSFYRSSFGQRLIEIFSTVGHEHQHID